MLRAVSVRVSPLLTLEPFSEKSTTSALRREAARVKLVRVRVLSSKNALTTTRPRSAGTFFTLRVETSLNEPAVSRTKRISSADNSSKDRRCFRGQRTSGDAALIVSVPCLIRTVHRRNRGLRPQPNRKDAKTRKNQ